MTEPQVFLNPPWALFPFSVFFAFSFPVTRVLWFFLNFGCLILLTRILTASFPEDFRVTARQVLLAALLFFPTVYCLWMGQLTLFVCTALTLSVIFLFRGQSFLASLPGCIVLWKPHLLLPALLILTLIALHRKLYSLFVFSALVAGCCVLYPLLWDVQVYQNWAAMDFSPLAYRTATFAAAIRELLLHTGGVAPKWPAIALPISASALLALIHFRAEKRSSLSLTSAFFVLVVSLSCAPYAWPYDFVLLLPIQLCASALIAHKKLPAKRKVHGVIALYLPQMLYLIQSIFVQSLGAGCWFPAALFCSWLYIRRLPPEWQELKIGGVSL